MKPGIFFAELILCVTVALAPGALAGELPSLQQEEGTVSGYDETSEKENTTDREVMTLSEYLERGDETWFFTGKKEYTVNAMMVKVIGRAMIACENSGHNVQDDFPEVRKIVEAGVTSKPKTDFELSRYACYLVVQNGDPRKEGIALGQTYFAIQTYRQEDYHREFGDTPFGLMIRKIAKLDHEAAMAAFSEFINDESLNQKQIAFVHKVINHIEQNGYMENVVDLQKPSFDKPVSFIKLFDAKKRNALITAIQAVKENAVRIAS